MHIIVYRTSRGCTLSSQKAMRYRRCISRLRDTYSTYPVMRDIFFHSLRRQRSDLMCARYLFPGACCTLLEQNILMQRLKSRSSWLINAIHVLPTKATKVKRIYMYSNNIKIICILDRTKKIRTTRNPINFLTAMSYLLKFKERLNIVPVIFQLIF